jgi:hypothetical protein
MATTLNVSSEAWRRYQRTLLLLKVWVFAGGFICGFLGGFLYGILR